MHDEKTLHCSFCGYSQYEVIKLFAGPSVNICEGCIDMCNKELINQREQKRKEYLEAKNDHKNIQD